MSLSRQHTCDLCKCTSERIIDAPTKTGQWAWMCKDCWSQVSMYDSFGPGKGQLFTNEKGGKKLEG